MPNKQTKKTDQKKTDQQAASERAQRDERLPSEPRRTTDQKGASRPSGGNGPDDISVHDRGRSEASESASRANDASGSRSSATGASAVGSSEGRGGRVDSAAASDQEIAEGGDDKGLKGGEMKRGGNPIKDTIETNTQAVSLPDVSRSGVQNPDAPSRGSSMQGPMQNAKGGPAGASQGGASRGSSRAEPSHVRDALKKDQRKKEPKQR